MRKRDPNPAGINPNLGSVFQRKMADTTIIAGQDEEQAAETGGRACVRDTLRGNYCGGGPQGCGAAARWACLPLARLPQPNAHHRRRNAPPVFAEGTTEDPERIIESVKNQTESDDKDLSPDGLVYNVSNLELEVER